MNYWVIGRVGFKLDSSKKNWLVFFMRVTDVMSFDRYHKEFRGRKDDLYDYRKKCICEDDNCEHRLNHENYHQHTNHTGHTANHDIGKGHYVLLSHDYCYHHPIKK